MTELSPYLSELNKEASPFTVREQTQRRQAAKLGKRWGRLLRRKGTEAALEDPDKARIWSWAAGLSKTWSRFRGHARQERLHLEIQASRSELQRYVNMAQYAINLAVKSESDPKRRFFKKRDLMEKWRRLYARAPSGR